MSDLSAPDLVFDALGEPARRRILELLRHGPVAVGALAEQLPIGRPAVSKHLRVLSGAQLIQYRRSGTRNLYSLAPQGLVEAQQWLIRNWSAPTGPGPVEEEPVTMPAIRRELLVDTTPAVAYELFTARLGAWWPLGDFGVHGEGATVAFEDDGRIVERDPGGASTCWGEVLVWQPPDLVRFTWHPSDAAVSSTVTVTFAAQEGQTRVALEHGGWEAFADPVEGRDGYDRGWPVVLEHYRAYVAETSEDIDATS